MQIFFNCFRSRSSPCSVQWSAEPVRLFWQFFCKFWEIVYHPQKIVQLFLCLLVLFLYFFSVRFRSVFWFYVKTNPRCFFQTFVAFCRPAGIPSFSNFLTIYTTQTRVLVMLPILLLKCHPDKPGSCNVVTLNFLLWKFLVFGLFLRKTSWMGSCNFLPNFKFLKKIDIDDNFEERKKQQN